MSGCPGCGKSSVILELEHAFGKSVVHEAAEAIIRLEQAHGREKPWEIPGFQRKIWDLQGSRMQNIPSDASMVFLDRYFVDCIVYSKDLNVIPELPKNMHDYLDTSIPVFFFESLGFCETNYYRKEDYMDAKRVEKMIYDEYVTHGFSIIRVPLDTVEKRAKFVLDSV